jgi:hypothetical protein
MRRKGEPRRRRLCRAETGLVTINNQVQRVRERARSRGQNEAFLQAQGAQVLNDHSNDDVTPSRFHAGDTLSAVNCPDTCPRLSRSGLIFAVSWLARRLHYRLHDEKN